MKNLLLLFFINYFFIFKISHAQLNNRLSTSPAPTAPTPMPVASTQGPTNVPTFDRLTPKCYPETATAYFLPAPSSSPKITVLNPNLKDVPPTLNQNVREKPLNLFKELPASLPVPPQNEMSSRVTLPPPPPCLTGLPDLLDEIPFKVQERISRFAQREEKAPVCESCAALLKSPIFNFDQELLHGFLAGIGL